MNGETCSLTPLPRSIPKIFAKTSPARDVVIISDEEILIVVSS